MLVTTNMNKYKTRYMRVSPYVITTHLTKEINEISIKNTGKH